MSWMQIILGPQRMRGVVMVAAISLVLFSSVATAEEVEEEPEEAEETEAAESTDDDAEVDEQGEAGDAEELVDGPDGVKYRIADQEVVALKEGEEVSSTSIACSGAAVVLSGHLYVACGERGVFVASVDDPTSPTPLALVPMDKEVEFLSVLNDELWLDYADGSGESVAPEEKFDVVASTTEKGMVGVAGTASDEDEGEEVESEEAVDDDGAPEDRDYAMIEVEEEDDAITDDLFALEGEIIEIRGGSAIINLGRENGLTKDQHVELYDIEYVRIGGEEIAKERSSGVGRVHTLGESYAEVSLPLNVRVQEGMLARVTDQGVTTQPQPVLENVLTVDASLRPFLPIDALGLGALGEFGMGYHFSGPWVFEVRVDPVGLTATDSDSDDIRTFAANAIISFVGDNFQVGLGTGLSRVHWGVGDRRMEEAPSTQDNVGVGAVQYVRLGQMEDVYLSLTTNFVVVDRAWQFGGAMLQGEAPARAIGDNMWYLGRIGGGVPGHFLFEVGLRQLISGNGGPGSVFVTPTVGFGRIARDIYREEENFEGDMHWVREDLGYSGPMIGFGVEWRQ